MPNYVLWGLKVYDTGIQLNDDLYIPTLIREYYNKMKQTVHHYYRELLMKLGVIIWLHVIYCMSGVISSFRTSFNFFLKCLGSLGGKKTSFWPVIAQQETRNLLFNQPDDTIPFLNLETHQSTLRRGWLLTKSFPQTQLKLQDFGQHKHHTEFW